jgi:hypothetical protein
MTQQPRSSPVQTNGWLPITPMEAGFAPDLEPRLDKAIADKRVWNLHGLVVLSHDRLLLERYSKVRTGCAASAKLAGSRSRPIQCTICVRARKASLACFTA